METKPDYVQDEITNPNKSKVNMNAKATYVPDEITNLALRTYIYIYIYIYIYDMQHFLWGHC